MALAEQLARAEDWGAIDALRNTVDLSPMECVAVAMTVDPKAAIRLLCGWPRRTSSCGKLGQEQRAG